MNSNVAANMMTRNTNMSVAMNNMSSSVGVQISSAPNSSASNATAGVAARYSGPGPIQRPPASVPAAAAIVQQRFSVGPAAVSTMNSAASRAGAVQHTAAPGLSAAAAAAAAVVAARSSSNPNAAQQAKLRAEALSSTQAFFSRDGEFRA